MPTHKAAAPLVRSPCVTFKVIFQALPPEREAAGGLAFPSNRLPSSEQVSSVLEKFMSDPWQAYSKLALSIEERESSARGAGDATQITASPVYQHLQGQIKLLHCENMNLRAELSRMQDAYSNLSRKNELLCAIISLEEGEKGEADDGDYYVASPMQSRRTH